MTQPPHFQTGTPIGNGNRTRDQESLFSDPKREDLDQRRRKFADDMAHAAVPAERDDFCKAFFPAPTDPDVLKQKPKLTENPFAALAEEGLKLVEATVRRIFTKAVNDNDLMPGFTMCECGERPDPAAFDVDKQKVDAAFYHSAHAPTDRTQRWPDQVIPVEFKRDESSLDPWDDSKDNISSEANDRKRGRGQCISYSELLFAIQHRVALFMLVIVGTRARFVRWDRSGTVVTRAFDYVEDWEFMCDILWRISLCSDAQLGLDPTATRLRPGDADYERMSAAAEEDPDDVDETERDLKAKDVPGDGAVYKYVRKMFSESVKAWPRYRVAVPFSKVDKVDKDDKDSKDDKDRTDSKNDEDGTDSKAGTDDKAGTDSKVGKKSTDSEGDKDGTDNGDDKAIRYFLIAKPTFRARGMSGRGTRGYVALDCETGKFVWLKDAWRAHYVLVDKEGDVLRRLNKAKVMNVPTLVCHGDIEDQVTLTPDWWEANNPLSKSKPEPGSSPSIRSALSTSSTLAPSSSASRKRKCDDERSQDSVPPPKGLSTGLAGFREDCPLRLHKHYRLVEKEVGMPLVNFQHSRQLISVVLDCIYAHFDAATKTEVKILHRDISGGNILIIPCVLTDKNGSEIKWRGLLTDWEMSKPMNLDKENGVAARQLERTGTWQFLSVALLSRPKEVEICDELEAFFYVILYYAVRYLRSNINESAVGTWISSFFDTYGVKGDTYICGETKLTTIQNGTLTAVGTDTTSTFVKFNSPLDDIFADLLRWFKANHVVTLADLDDDELTGVSSLTLPSSSRSSIPRAGRPNPRPRAGRDNKAKARRKAAGPAVGEPTAEDRAFSDYVRTHDEVMDRLEEALDDASVHWSDDKVGDHVAKDYQPPVLASGPTLPPTLAGNKRQKVDGGAFAVSLPILPSARYPPKTPERKTTGVPSHTTGYLRGKGKRH